MCARREIVRASKHTAALAPNDEIVGKVSATGGAQQSNASPGAVRDMLDRLYSGGGGGGGGGGEEQDQEEESE